MRQVGRGAPHGKIDPAGLNYETHYQYDTLGKRMYSPSLLFTLVDITKGC
jgi:hypothetical protein